MASERRAVTAAILVASCAPSLIYLMFCISVGYISFGIYLSFYVFVIACAHAVILDLPIFMLLKKLKFVPFWISPVIGYIVGWLPYTIAKEIEYPILSLEDFFFAASSLGVIGSVCATLAWVTWWNLYEKYNEKHVAFK